MEVFVYTYSNAYCINAWREIKFIKNEYATNRPKSKKSHSKLVFIFKCLAVAFIAF